MTITVTAVPESTSPPRVLVSITTSVPLTEQLELYRLHDSTGETHLVILPDRISMLVAGTWADYDRHAPTNQTVRYKAIAGATVGVSTSVIAVSQYAWLLHPSDPDLAVLVDRNDVHLGPAGSPQYGTRSTLFQIVDGERVSQPGGRRDLSGTMSVVCRTDETLLAVLALLADDGPVLVSTPYSSNNLGWLWIQPGNVTVDNAAGSNNPIRTVQIPYDRVTQPDVDLEPDWTAGELAATGWTAGFAKTVYATALDMKLDRRL